MFDALRRPAALSLAAVLLAAACTGGATPVPSSSSAPSAPASTPSAPASPSPDPTASPEPTPAPSLPPAWSAVAVSGSAPAAREDHTWTVQPDAGVAWLFGGRDGATVFDDLWRYDLAADRWERRATSGPAPGPRFGHTGTWVPGIGLVIWSGQRVGFYDDIWAFDPVSGSWRELADRGDRPAARYGSCAALGPDGRLWISHGFTEDAGRFSDTVAFDFASNRWTDSTPDGRTPVVRCLHDCLFAPDGRFVLYAGQTTGAPAIGDLWTRPIDGGWAAAPDDGAPPPRQLYALASAGSTAWVFGGGGEDRGALGDVWALDLDSLAWRQLRPEGAAPAPRSGAAAIHDAGRDRVLVHGGLGTGGALDDLWALRP